MDQYHNNIGTLDKEQKVLSQSKDKYRFCLNKSKIKIQILTCVNTPSDYGPSDLKSPTVVSFTLTREDIHTQTALCSAAFVYQRLDWDPTKRGARLHKVSQRFHPIGFLSHYFFFFFFFNRWSLVSGSCTMLTSWRQREHLHPVVRAQTWVRANMVLYWFPVTGTFSTGSEIYVYSRKNMHETSIDASALYTAHPY